MKRLDPYCERAQGRMTVTIAGYDGRARRGSTTWGETLTILLPLRTIATLGSKGVGKLG